MAVKQVFNTSAELDYPTVLPTLDLDFANSKTLDPRITFTRASGGSYVGADGLIKYAGVNEARFDHDPETGESLGLLIEEARTNLFTTSTDILSFGITGSTVFLDGTQSPDGTLSAVKVVTNQGENLGGLRGPLKDFSSTSGVVYTFSCFVKSAEIKSFTLRTSPTTGAGPPARFFVNYFLTSKTLVVGSGSSPILSAQIIEYPGGWFRCSMTYQSDFTGTIRHRFVPGTTEGISDGVSSLYIWGPQLEVGTFPTSYIPTQASTRTRALDNARIIGKNFSSFYNLDEGSIFVDFLNTPNSSSAFPTIYSFYDPITGAGQNRVQLVKFSEVYNIRITDVSNGLAQSAYNIASGYKVFDNIKVFRTYGFKNYIGSVNGTTPRPPGTFNTTNPTPSKLISALNIGSGQNGDAPINAPVKRFTYYSKALPPSQLQALTS